MTYSAGKLKELSKQAKYLLSLIQKRGPVTRKQLILLTKMKTSTLKRFMQPLVDNGLVIEAAIGESTGGRPPVLYDINPDVCFVIGIDISRTYVQVVITNLKMEVVDSKRFMQHWTPEEMVNHISLYIDNGLRQLLIDKSMVLGVGIGTVGPLDRMKGVILNPSNFPVNGWSNVPIRKMIEQALQLPTIIDNGSNMAVLAEYYFGIGKGVENIAYFNCGIGIRTGAISSGYIIRTINDAEDAFGHMVFDVGGELCSCGNYGCIECYTSIPSIMKKYISQLRNGRFSSIKRSLEEISYIDVCAAAEEKEELAREEIINAAAIFGSGLANYINLLNPNLVIISGPLVKHSTLFYETCVQVASKRIYSKQGNTITFNREGYFRDTAIAVGAAAQVVEEMIKTE